MWDFITERRNAIAYDTLQHLNLTFQALLLATVIAVLIAALVTRFGWLEAWANLFSAIGLTLPSFALIGLLLPLAGLGNITAFTCVAFYAVLPVLRNAVVGLAGVNPVLLESARGMGMSELKIFRKVRLPLAWPVILAGIRISMQMSMGIAAIAAYVRGPGLGSYLFTGIATVGNANAAYFVWVGVVGVVLVALLADVLLVLLGRLTVSKGIRTA